jgi:hypothetical protein
MRKTTFKKKYLLDPTFWFGFWLLGCRNPSQKLNKHTLKRWSFLANPSPAKIHASFNNLVLSLLIKSN